MPPTFVYAQKDDTTEIYIESYPYRRSYLSCSLEEV